MRWDVSTYITKIMIKMNTSSGNFFSSSILYRFFLKIIIIIQQISITFDKYNNIIIGVGKTFFSFPPGEVFVRYFMRWEVGFLN